MLAATLLALAAAVLHALWNLAIKAATFDRYLALWGQFFAAALLFTPLTFVFGGMPATAWVWVGISGAVHLPYCFFLARAYDSGDFSLVYPIARGTGAVLAAVGGVLLLDDQLSWWSAGAIGVVGCGLILLAGRGDSADVARALVVAVTIGIYSTADARGIRSAGTALYAFASMSGTAVSTTLFGLASGRARAMRTVFAENWGRFAVVGFASTITYGMVQLAFQRAPVGYVTALRESSVVLAAYLGWKRLGERAGARRIAATVVVALGLVALVVSRT